MVRFSSSCDLDWLSILSGVRIVSMTRVTRVVAIRL